MHDFLDISISVSEKILA